MADATLSWKPSLSGTPTDYLVTWTYNGTAQPPIDVKQTAALDASGYTLDFNSSEPTITLKPGDTLSATVTAFDSVNNLSSAPVASNSVTVPTPPPPPPVPPGPPQLVTLALA